VNPDDFDRRSPYRAPAAQATPDVDRLWFTKVDDVVKGPFEAEMIVRSLKSGRLKLTAMARGEHEAAWTAIHDIPLLWRGGRPKPAAFAKRAPENGDGKIDPERRAAFLRESEGRFGLGFCIGFFFGVIGVWIVHARSMGAKTRRGAWAGAAVGFVIGGLLAAVATVASVKVR
jgi:hypothetical protein